MSNVGMTYAGSTLWLSEEMGPCRDGGIRREEGHMELDSFLCVMIKHPPQPASE